MRDPNRIPRILETVRRIWEKEPDLRLGQLIVNAIRPSRPCPQVFGFEDSKLEDRLANYLAPNGPRHTEDEIVLSLTANEAIVLIAFLMRFRDADKLRIEHPVEQQVLYDLAALVQQHLTDELTDRAWPWHLEQARQAVLSSEE